MPGQVLGKGIIWVMDKAPVVDKVWAMGKALVMEQACAMAQDWVHVKAKARTSNTILRRSYPIRRAHALLMGL